MAKFSAESISDIEYDFRGFKDKDGAPIEDWGAIPEPSRQQVNTAMEGMTAAFEDLGVGEVESSAEGISSAMDKIRDERTFEKMQEKLLDTIADLCNGKPSRDSLERLPYRAFMGFWGYLMGEVMSPEVSKPGTSATQPRLRSV